MSSELDYFLAWLLLVNLAFPVVPGYIGYLIINWLDSTPKGGDA